MGRRLEERLVRGWLMGKQRHSLHLSHAVLADVHKQSGIKSSSKIDLPKVVKNKKTVNAMMLLLSCLEHLRFQNDESMPGCSCREGPGSAFGS